MFIRYSVKLSGSASFKIWQREKYSWKSFNFLDKYFSNWTLDFCPISQTEMNTSKSGIFQLLLLSIWAISHQITRLKCPSTKTFQLFHCRLLLKLMGYGNRINRKLQSTIILWYGTIFYRQWEREREKEAASNSKKIYFIITQIGIKLNLKYVDYITFSAFCTRNVSCSILKLGIRRHRRILVYTVAAWNFYNRHRKSHHVHLKVIRTYSWNLKHIFIVVYLVWSHSKGNLFRFFHTKILLLFLLLWWIHISHFTF